MCGGDRGGGCWLLGICAVALGAGILIAAIFPVGALMFQGSGAGGRRWSCTAKAAAVNTRAPSMRAPSHSMG